MSQFYEIMTILSPNESEEDVQAIVGGLRQQINTSGGQVLAVDIWGKRKLAYPIQKFDEGTYVLIHCEGPANLPGDFRQHTRIRESVLREMVVKLDPGHEADVRDQIAEQGPEDEEVAAAQIAAAKERAAAKLAQVTAPVTDAAKAGVKVVTADEIEAEPDAEPAPEAPPVAEAAAEAAVADHDLETTEDGADDDADADESDDDADSDEEK